MDETGNPVDAARTRREFMRWVLLIALRDAPPESGTHESVLLSTLQGVYADATAAELRRELDYLGKRGLATIHRAPSGPWRVCLTRQGLDVVEYTVDVEPGIARPLKYW